METETDKSLNYLDLTISIEANNLQYQIFRKPTFTDSIVHARSKQSYNIKLSGFHSNIHRLLTLPLSSQNYSKEVNILKNIASNNGYNPTLIDKLIAKKKEKLMLKQFYPTQNVDPKKYVYTNFIPNITPKINNRLKRYNLKPVSTNKSNLGSLLVNNKERLTTLNKSGVYEVNCTDCNAIYIGQSGRSIKCRISEHRKDIINNRRSTGFADHCITNNHYIDVNNIKLLHSSPKGKRLDLFEILEIKKAQKEGKFVTNENTDFNISPLIKSAI